MMPKPKPVKKFLAGSSLRSPDPVERGATPAVVVNDDTPRPPISSGAPLSMTPAAIRKREEREKRANARQYARAIVGVPSYRFHKSEKPKPEKKPRKRVVKNLRAALGEDDPTPRGWMLMPNDSIAQRDAKQQRREEGGGHRVTPQGTSGIIKTDSNIRAGNKLEPLNRFENQPVPRAKSTFKVRMPESLAFLRRYLNRPPDEDTKRSILHELSEMVFETSGEMIHCKLCNFSDNWQSRATQHLEDMIETEITAHAVAKQKADDLQDGYERLALQSGMTPITVAPVALGLHARHFMNQITVRDRHAREIRKTVKRRKTRPSDVVETKAVA